MPADGGQGRVPVAVALGLDLDQVDVATGWCRRSCPATHSACQRASGLPRVPIRTALAMSPSLSRSNEPMSRA